MSLEKTKVDDFRSFTELKKYPVNETLPAFFETEYPKLVRFLENYYEEAGEETVEKYLESLQYKRDFVKADQDLLRFFSQELLLGRDYFDLFVDKQTAIQTSNLLYRSKGSKYSIQQFFRVFFGFDVEVKYGRDEVFYVGDPFGEKVEYRGQYVKGTLFPGRRVRFNFDDGEVRVYAEKTDGRYVELRQDIDFSVYYSDTSVLFNKDVEPIEDDANLNFLAENGMVAEGAKIKIETDRFSPSGSMIGDEVTEKKVTNNGYYQLFSIRIKSPVGINKWKEAYKDFIHPAGMYLEGLVTVSSVAKVFGKQPSATTDRYVKLVEETAELIAFLHTQISELTLRSYEVPREELYSSQWSELDSNETPYTEIEIDESDRPDEVWRLRVNDLEDNVVTLEELDRQYVDIRDIDKIDPRRMDDNLSDMSQTWNTMDENFWNKHRQDALFGPACPDQWILGNVLDFPPEYPGCPGFIFAMGPQHLQAQYDDPKHMDSYYAGANSPDYWTDSDHPKYIGNQVRSTTGPVQGLTEWKITAYRDYKLDMYSIDYTTEIPSATPSAVWIGDIDYSNPWGRAQINATVVVVENYFRTNYIDNYYSAENKDKTV